MKTHHFLYAMGFLVIVAFIIYLISPENVRSAEEQEYDWSRQGTHHFIEIPSKVDLRMNETCILPLENRNVSREIALFKTHVTYRVISVLKDLKMFSNITEIPVNRRKRFVKMSVKLLKKECEILNYDLDSLECYNYTSTEIDDLIQRKNYIQTTIDKSMWHIQEISRNNSIPSTFNYEPTNSTDALWKIDYPFDGVRNNTLTSYFEEIENLWDNFNSDGLYKSVDVKAIEPTPTTNLMEIIMNNGTYSKNETTNAAELNSRISPANLLFHKYRNVARTKELGYPMDYLTKEITRAENGTNSRVSFNLDTFGILHLVADTEYQILSRFIHECLPFLRAPYICYPDA